MECRPANAAFWFAAFQLASIHETCVVVSPTRIYANLPTLVQIPISQLRPLVYAGSVGRLPRMPSHALRIWSLPALWNVQQRVSRCHGADLASTRRSCAARTKERQSGRAYCLLDMLALRSAVSNGSHAAINPAIQIPRRQAGSLQFGSALAGRRSACCRLTRYAVHLARRLEKSGRRVSVWIVAAFCTQRWLTESCHHAFRAQLLRAGVFERLSGSTLRPHHRRSIAGSGDGVASTRTHNENEVVSLCPKLWSSSFDSRSHEPSARFRMNGLALSAPPW
jgi:hypothetical protein